MHVTITEWTRVASQQTLGQEEAAATTDRGLNASDCSWLIVCLSKANTFIARNAIPNLTTVLDFRVGPVKGSV